MLVLGSAIVILRVLLASVSPRYRLPALSIKPEEILGWMLISGSFFYCDGFKHWLSEKDNKVFFAST